MDKGNGRQALVDVWKAIAPSNALRAELGERRDELHLARGRYLSAQDEYHDASRRHSEAVESLLTSRNDSSTAMGEWKRLLKPGDVYSWGPEFGNCEVVKDATIPGVHRVLFRQLGGEGRYFHVTLRFLEEFAQEHSLASLTGERSDG